MGCKHCNGEFWDCIFIKIKFARWNLTSNLNISEKRVDGPYCERDGPYHQIVTKQGVGLFVSVGLFEENYGIIWLVSKQERPTICTMNVREQNMRRYLWKRSSKYYK